jgi:hypothetical protein
MASRIAWMLLGCMALALSTMPARSAELLCAGEAGALLAIGSQGANRLGLAEPEGLRMVELERWNICFTCAGFPRLDMAFKDPQTGMSDVRILAEARICRRSTAPDSPEPDKYCIGRASVWEGRKEARTCAFPDETTLATLWTALTRSAPPDQVAPWWSHPRH